MSLEPCYRVVTPRKEVRESRSFNPAEFTIALDQEGSSTPPARFPKAPWVCLAFHLGNGRIPVTATLPLVCTSPTATGHFDMSAIQIAIPLRGGAVAAGRAHNPKVVGSSPTPAISPFTE